jgi:hypothetical protein
MAIDALEITRSLLAYQVETDRGSLERLLKRNGVTVPMGASDTEVTSAVILASGKSPNFKKELSALLASNAKKAGQEFQSFVGQEMGFTGLDDFSFTGEEGFYNIAAGFNPKTSSDLNKAVADAKKSGKVKTPRKEGEKTTAGKVLGWIGTNVFTKENIDTAVQVGLTKINTKTQNKANQVAQEGLQIQQYQDDIRNQQGRQGGKGLSTGAWIGIGLGVAALVGIVIYFTTKKK